MKGGHCKKSDILKWCEKQPYSFETMFCGSFKKLCIYHTSLDNKTNILKVDILEELWDAVDFGMSPSEWCRNTAWSWRAAKSLTNTASDLWFLFNVSLFFFFPMSIKYKGFICFGNPHIIYLSLEPIGLMVKLVTLESNSCGFKYQLCSSLALWNWASYFIFLSHNCLWNGNENFQKFYISIRNAVSIILLSFFTF